MDKRTQFSRLKKMLDEYDKDEISFDELRALISINIASTPKIVENAIKLMGIGGLLKDIGQTKFQIIRQIEKMDKCSKCGKEMRTATADDLNGLVWADELQKWVCPSCERARYPILSTAQ